MEINRVDHGSQQPVMKPTQEEIQAQGRQQEERTKRDEIFIRSLHPSLTLENRRALATEVEDVDQATAILGSLTSAMANQPGVAMLLHGSLDAERVASLLAR